MKKIAPFLVLLAGILWGTIGLFVRVLNSAGLSSMEIVMIRAVTTTILLFVYLAVTDKSLLKIRIKDIWCFLGTGICSIVFFNYCYFKTISMTSLSVAAVLLYTAPAIVMLLSALLFHEKITNRKIIALCMTFTGCIFVTGLVGMTDGLSLPGFFVGLGAGLGYALYSIFGRFALERGYHSLTISFYTFLFAMLGTLPLCNLKQVAAVSSTDFKFVIFFFVFGLFSTVIPYIVYTLGLKEMENSKASIIASIEPVTATLLGILVYHEMITVNEVIGVALVIGSIVLQKEK
ncbi:MAG: DMT family transporter [Lachnospiraceae bacterium]